MLPLNDAVKPRKRPYLVYTIVLINVLVFLWEVFTPTAQLNLFFRNYALVPARVVSNPFSIEVLLDFLRSMFLHGSWTHLIGNMTYLWIFGDVIEDYLGRWLFIGFYLIGGIIAGLAQVAINPASTIPMIGASGAIAAVLGGYIVLFPGANVKVVVPVFLFRTFVLPALIVHGFWFLLQLFNGLLSLGAPSMATSRVAFFAHIGGFLGGALIMFIYTMFGPEPQRLTELDNAPE